MANQFDFLAKAKPATLHRLLAKLSIQDAAIVLTRLPDTLAVQAIAYFPEAGQVELGPAMVEARWESGARVEETAGRIRTLLAEAKKAATGGASSPAQNSEPNTPGSTPNSAPRTPAAAPGKNGAGATGANNTVTTGANNAATTGANHVPATAPHAIGPLPPRRSPPRPSAAPTPRPGDRAAHGMHGNPYQAAPGPAAAAPPLPDTPRPDAPPPKASLVDRAKKAARDMVKATLSPPDNATRKAADPPRPWIPRAATASPINGPALPDTPPPVAGDPFKSPLAKAGLLELIGRAQQTLLPKGAARPPTRSGPASGLRPAPKHPAGRAAGGPERPEPREGMAPRKTVSVSKTPRVIGPRSAAAGAPDSGARRMDGGAILAAILREANAEVRDAVRNDDPALFRRLRERMFHFDDLALAEDNALARVFTAASAGDAALALRFAAPALRDRVMRVVSPGRARALREGAPGRAGVDAVERAQKKVLDVALQLQAAGRILIDPGDPDLVK